MDGHTISEWLAYVLGISPELQERIAATAAILFITLMAQRAVRQYVIRRFHDPETRYRWRKTANYVGYVLVTFLVGRVWFEGFQDISTFLGLVSAGLAVALQQPITNLAGWLFIVWRRPFEVGDRVQIADKIGDVIDIRLFEFSMLEVGNWVDAEQSTGRVLYIPNGKIFADIQASYSAAFKFIWQEIPVLLTFESDWQKAKAILEEIASDESLLFREQAARGIREAENMYIIRYRNLGPKVYTTVKDSGVLLTIRYLCDPRQRRDSDERVWERILTTFSHHQDIDFAYPSQRVFYHPVEGKHATKAARPQTTEIPIPDVNPDLPDPVSGPYPVAKGP